MAVLILLDSEGETYAILTEQVIYIYIFYIGVLILLEILD